MTRSVNGKQSLIRDVAVGIGLAATVFALSYADGGFAPTTRAYAGMAAWWLLGVGAAFGIASAWSSIDRLAVVAVGLFAAFAVWTLISVRWAADAERAFAQFNQVALYVAVFAIAIVLARLDPGARSHRRRRRSTGRRGRRRARQPLLPQHLRGRPGRGDPEPAQQRPAELPARLLERARDRGRARLSAPALAHELAEVAAREHARGACPCRSSPRSCISPRRAAPSSRPGSPW